MNASMSQKFFISAVIASLSTAYIAMVPFSAEAAIATTTKDKKTLNLTCMQTAIDTRETALISAFGDFKTSMDEALSDRKTALHDAWGISDRADRNKAIKTAWSDWRKDKKETYAELKSDRKTAWTTFAKTAKSTCKETLPKDESLDKDTSGTIAL